MSVPRPRCWWCNKTLEPLAGAHGKLFHSATVRDKEGNSYRVHIVCKQVAQASIDQRGKMQIDPLVDEAKRLHDAARKREDDR